MKHCDEYIDDPKYCNELRVFLFVNRLPAVEKILLNSCGFDPVLYADYNGQTVRVTMASRLGDVGISYNLHEKMGYDLRVTVAELSNFRNHLVGRQSI